MVAGLDQQMLPSLMATGSPKSTKMKFQKYRESQFKNNLTSIGPDGRVQLKYIFNDINNI